MRYFTSDTHFGHPLVSVLRGHIKNGRIRAEYMEVWRTQGRDAAHAWIRETLTQESMPFTKAADVASHDEAIIAGINERVGADDELWLLGDVSFRCTVAHTLECLRRLNCKHLHMIIGNHDRNFRLRSNDKLYEDVFETIDDYREIELDLPALTDGHVTLAQDGSVRTAPQMAGMSHFPRATAMLDGRGTWPDDRDKFLDVAPETDGWLIYGHTHQEMPDGTDPLCVNVGEDAWGCRPVSEREVIDWLIEANRTNK